MAGNVSGQNPNIANDTAYKGIEKKTVYASADGNQDTKIDLNEAKAKDESIFTSAANGESQLINKKIGLSLLSDVKGEVAKATVQKYLGGTTMGKLINNWAGFGEINYNAVEVADGDFEGDAKAKIDQEVSTAIQQKVQSYTSQITSQFEAALEHAIQQAENEIKGDLQADTQKFGANGRKGLTKQQFANIEYRRTSEEYGAEGNERNTNIATFNSSQLDTEDANKTKGYTTTVAFLEANGAKAQEKIVNGTKQTIYKVKIDGETQYVSVDDAGQVHTMDRDKGFLRTSKYTTDDSIADAKWQANNDGIAGNDFTGAQNVDVKVRNVDGQNQSVLTWEDSSGNEHSRVIDHNEVTGLTSSSDVHQVNAPGTRAKYTSETSGLGTWVAADDAGADVRQFNGDKHMVQDEVKNGKPSGFVRTNNSRMKIDADNIESAINNIALLAQNAGATVEGTKIETVTTETVEYPEKQEFWGKNGPIDFGDQTPEPIINKTTDTIITPSENGITKITINGHTYELDTKDPQAADRTIRLIENELQFGGTTPEVVQPTLQNTTLDIEFDDGRTDTNLKEAHEDDSYKDGTKNVKDVGVDSPTTHKPKSKRVVGIAYNDDSLSRTQFASEGWAASKGRTEEAEVLRAMDNTGARGDGKHVRNLKDSKQFATRLLQVLDKECRTPAQVEAKYNIDLLAKALETANPSIFDNKNDGAMFKNVDFNRINLPEADKLKRYLKAE